MSFLRGLKRLFGISDPVDNLFRDFGVDIDRTATLAGSPRDDALMKLAQERKGHISLKAVDDEYERLILEKYGRR